METALQPESTTENTDRTQELFSIFVGLFEGGKQDDRIPLPKKTHLKVADYGNIHKSARIIGEAILKYRGGNADTTVILPGLIESIFQHLVAYQESHVQEASDIINGIKARTHI